MIATEDVAPSGSERSASRAASNPAPGNDVLYAILKARTAGLDMVGISRQVDTIAGELYRLGWRAGDTADAAARLLSAAGK